MTALARSRNTPRRAVSEANLAPFYVPVKAATVLYAGGIGCLDSSGNACPGAATAGLITMGRIEEDVDNSAGAAADKFVNIRPGVYRWVNSDTITKAHIGDMCYVVDDQTVAKGSATEARPGAGIIVDVDSDGVWVAMGLAESQLAAILIATTVVA